MLNALQYRILRSLYPRSPDLLVEAGDRSKLDLLGSNFLSKIPGKSVIDFGCGIGTEAIEMAQRGAVRVIGIDIREECLQIAREAAARAGVQDRCTFTTSTSETSDIIVSIDAFEHFKDPAEILRIMNTLLKPDGEILLSFGPTWYHPLGGHLFSVCPWAHLMFSEDALIRWRSTFKTDGATRFSEVAGGLNQITIKKFEKLVAESDFWLLNMERVPIGRLKRVHNRLTSEFTTALVRGELVKRESSLASSGIYSKALP
ncbi:methyltransferase domain-containing protein [Edaphobacter paludis]|uniref:Methyltransferase domain-containing protein n=1 Tax=Edaphobacter paludis TaxID=3035702 RepID=A0AAU7D358_9BACT